MSIKTWQLMLFASISFIVSGIMSLSDKSYLRGGTFILLGLYYVGLSRTKYLKDSKSSKSK
ncbi:hypothetical protein [Clostridium beijerinckii]|uniref:hypothetical protein n=1 Tax=Clostridium beijerinckii TaxID=1520 RepID=UPI00047CE21F|nr:hypothetical protein [Clostridium beijerinckii]